MNPWILLGAAGLCVLAFFYGKSVGHDVESAKWTTRENTELKSANDKIIELEDKARAQEMQHAKTLNAISTKYQKELSDAKIRNTADLAAISAGTLRLLDRATCESGVGSPAGTVGSSASRCDGAAGTELSRPASEFLLSLANEADEVTRQLARCQDVILADRQLQ